MTNHWDNYHRHWTLLEAPLRPTPETVGIVRRELDPDEADVLLLGVTPELAGLGRTMLSVDGSAAMVSGVWPGDSAGRRAMVGNWLDLPLGPASVGAVIGDGCLTVVDSARARRALLGEVARVLKPEGRAAIRVFAGPEIFEDLPTIRAEAFAGRIGNFHALKWRVAMAGATDDRDRAINVQAIRNAFDETFPDRAALALATGWSMASIGTIDVYSGSDTMYCFATLAMLVEEAKGCFDDVRVVPSGAYPLAERCPLLVLGGPRRR